MRRLRSALIVTALVLVLALLAFRLLRPAAVEVELARVARRPLLVTVDEEGETRVKQRYVVAAPVTGYLERITLRPGDSVRRGEVVAWLEPTPLDPRASEQATSRLAAAEDAARVADAAVAAARAALDQASRTRVRAESLAASGLVAPEEREHAELAETTRARELDAARFQAQAAVHEVDAARAALLAATRRGPRSARVPARAPATGRVLRLFEESERVLLAGTPLLSVGDPRQLEIVSDLLSVDAVRVARGDTVLVERWGGPEALRAVVTRVEPSAFTKVSALGVEEQRVNVLADLITPPPELGDGFRVEVRVVVWRGDSVLTVPTGALLRRNGDWAVFQVWDGRARLRRIEVGQRGDDWAEVLSGLADGDAVVRQPGDQLRDGSRVSATKPAKSGP